MREGRTSWGWSKLEEMGASLVQKLPVGHQWLSHTSSYTSQPKQNYKVTFPHHLPTHTHTQNPCHLTQLGLVYSISSSQNIFTQPTFRKEAVLLFQTVLRCYLASEARSGPSAHCPHHLWMLSLHNLNPLDRSVPICNCSWVSFSQ